MESELKRTGVNRWVLWGEYRQKHPDGFSYSQFCDIFKQWRIGLSASMRIEHVPGDKLYIDFTGDRLSTVDAITGEVTDQEVYVATLGASQYSYVEAIPSQKKEDLIAATENAFHYFGGVTKALVPDNLKSAVTKADRYELEFSQTRGLDKMQILRLADMSFIKRKENVLICGATGSGKSFIASALGNQACMQGVRTLYYNTTKLFPKLKMLKADGSYMKEIGRMEKQDLLILDDFGIQQLDEMGRMALLEIIEDRHGRASTIVVSQLPVTKWFETIGDSTIADAILDRLVHTAHRIELKGESMRKKR